MRSSIAMIHGKPPTDILAELPVFSRRNEAGTSSELEEAPARQLTEV